jgi:hypothetical protein
VSPRDTRTGDVLEQMILPAMERGGYRVSRKVNIGTRPAGTKHYVDAVADNGKGRVVLVELKWQQTLRPVTSWANF